MIFPIVHFSSDMNNKMERLLPFHLCGLLCFCVFLSSGCGQHSVSQGEEQILISTHCSGSVQDAANSHSLIDRAEVTVECPGVPVVAKIAEQGRYSIEFKYTPGTQRCIQRVSASGFESLTRYVPLRPVKSESSVKLLLLPLAKTNVTLPRAPNSSDIRQAKQSPPVLDQSKGLWGEIKPVEGDVETNEGPIVHQNPNDVVRSFLSSNHSPRSIGATTAWPDPTFQMPCDEMLPPNKCGVFLTMEPRAELETALQIVDVVHSKKRIAIQSGVLRVVIWDSELSKLNAEGQHYTPIPVSVVLNGANSWIQSDRVNLEFKDQEGSITLTGILQGTRISGVIDFKNLDDYKHSGHGARGRLGEFAINACGIFAC